MNTLVRTAPRREDGLALLRSRFGNRASSAADVVEQHSHDESHHQFAAPDLVVSAQSTDDVVKCMQICRDHALPVIPFGVGTSLEGHVQAMRGGVSLDMSGMSRILRVSMEDFDCTVEAGVTRRQLAAHLKSHGLFFPVDPGADATLGSLRLFGHPESILAAAIQFDDLHSTVSAVSTIIQLGVGVARIELLDDAAVAAVNAHSGLGLTDSHMLLFEFHGSPESVEDDAKTARAVVEEHGGVNWQSTTDQAERGRLWRARHDAAWAVRARRVGGQLFVTDVCVPISQLADTIEETRVDLAEHDIYGPIIGHVGDGNFHVVCVVPPNDPAELHRIEEFNERLITRALDAGGTGTGEHGIGLGKSSHLHRELGEGAIAVMRAIKRAIDPDDIMNPGKVTGGD